MQVKERHAHLQKEADGKYVIEDLFTSGTWLNGRKLIAGQRHKLCPGDEIAFGAKQDKSLTYRVKLIHASVWNQLNSEEGPKEDERSRDLIPA